MAILQVRDVPAELYEKLSQIAKEENRSISQQTIVILKKAVKTREGRSAKRKVLFEQIEDIPVDPVKELPDPVTLIREDRDR